MDAEARRILERGASGADLSVNECIRLLSFPEDSVESRAVTEWAQDHVRVSHGNSCSLGIQIGVITGPCIADCRFCGFAQSTTRADDYVMPADVLRGYLRHATAYGDVESVSLMTIHNFDFDNLLEAVKVTRSTVPEGVAVCVNTGDLTSGELSELRSAGVSRAYHALRLGEGDDSRLSPLDRFSTIRRIFEAGIEAVSGVEPIGPEHTSKEIVDLYRTAREAGCAHCSASRRVCVPGTGLANAGEISPARLLQIRSVLMLSTGDGYYGGYYGGFDRDYAEYAGNPRDNADYSESSLGNTIESARRRMLEAGYDWIIGAGDRRFTLDLDHLEATGSDYSQKS